MSAEILEAVNENLMWHLSRFDKVTADLTDEQLNRVPGSAAPPIGWHYWHTMRCTDLLQASFPNQRPEAKQPVHPERDIWKSENMAAAWGLDPAQLGVLQSGIDMPDEVAFTLTAKAGRERLVAYGERVLRELDAALAKLDPAVMTEPRLTVYSFVWDNAAGKAVEDFTEETIVVEELVSHCAHIARHLGMIEGLRGVILDRSGTMSV